MESIKLLSLWVRTDGLEVELTAVFTCLRRAAARSERREALLSLFTHGVKCTTSDKYRAGCIQSPNNSRFYWGKIVLFYHLIILPSSKEKIKTCI